jgi:hypothetical protein
MTLAAHLFDLAFEVTHPLTDPPSLDFDLLLTETATGSNTATTPTNLAVVCVRADQPRQEVMQPCRFDLQAAFVRARVLGEDLEDHLSAVEDPGLQLELEVPLLPGTQVLVAHDHVKTAFQPHRLQLFDLAHANEVPGIDLAAALHIRAHDLRAGCACELRQLRHLLLDQLSRTAWKQDAD